MIRIESSHTNPKKGKWVPGLKGVLCQRRGSPFEMMERREGKRVFALIVRKDSCLLEPKPHGTALLPSIDLAFKAFLPTKPPSTVDPVDSVEV